MTPEGTVSYIDLAFSMVSKTVAEERSSYSVFRKSLLLCTIIIHNYCGLIDTYLPIMNVILLTNLGQNVGSTISLTRIVIFQVLGLTLFYNPHLEFAEQEKRGVMQQFLYSVPRNVRR